MLLTEEDLKIIADHIVHNIDKLAERYTKCGSYLDLDDYILTNVATDLMYRYSRYQIEEAFQDRRIIVLLQFFLTDQDYASKNTIH